LAIAPLARKYGANTHYTYIQQFLVCSCCGKKGIALTAVRWDDDRPDAPLAY
jgi:hypothetical protein